MHNLLTNIIFPSLLLIGFIALGIKHFLNFKYFKIAYRYPSDLTYFKFLSSFQYFIDIFLTIIPIYFKINLVNINDKEKLICRRLEKHMKICLILFYIGLRNCLNFIFNSIHHDLNHCKLNHRFTRASL